MSVMNFGLWVNVLPLVVSTALAAGTSHQQCSGIPGALKQECGYAGVTQTQCEQKDCCWQAGAENSDTPWCFQKMPSTLTFIDHKYKGDRFKDKNIVVFGGTSGMGFATAAMLLQECAAKVVIASRNSMQGKLAQYVLANISQVHCDHAPPAGAHRVTYMQADIRKREDIRRVFAMFNDVTHLHHVVSTAAIPGFVGGLQDMPEDYPLGENDANLNNLYGSMYVTSEAQKVWELQSCNANGDMPCPLSGPVLKHGFVPSLVHTSSEQGMTPCPECSTYATSKHAIIGLTTSVAMAYEGSMRANVVLPGLTDTPFSWNQVRGAAMLPNGSWVQKHSLQTSWQCVKDGKVVHANCPGGASGYGCPCEDVRPDDPRIKAIWPPPYYPLVDPRQIGSAILKFLDAKSTANGMSWVSNKNPPRQCQEQTKAGVPLFDLCPVEPGRISRLI